tara:strand:- start:7404 stop:9332 length:1929 start_codon:yes stop_codon:yes gene_type:complete
MATQNRRGYSNPYGSADLGSGVRTTTGGSYRNPRLGIEDYTAWSKMNVQAPGIKEKGKIKFDGFDVFGDEIDTFTGGRTFNSEFFNVLTNNFKNGELSEYQKLFENGNTETQNGVQAHVNGWADDFKKLQSYMTKWTDDQVYDPNVSDTRLPSAEIDGYSDMTYAFFVEDTSKNPKDWTAKTIVNSNNIPHRVLEKISTGQQFSITAMTEERMSKDFNVKADLSGDVQASILKDGTAQGYKGVEPSYNTDNTSITVNLPDGTTVQTNKNSAKYIRQGWYNDTDQYATIFADKKYASKYDATYKSAWYQLAQRFKNGSFTPQHKEDENGNVISSLKNEMLQKYNIDNISKIGEIDILNEDRIKLLRDEAQEEFKILNGSVGYDRDENKFLDDEKTIPNPNYGRALDKRVVQYNTDNIIKPRTGDDASGLAFGSFFSAQSPIEGLKSDFKRAVGEGTKDYEFKGNLVDLIDKDNIDVLQKEVTKLQPGTYIGKRDTLENMYRQAAFTSGSSESVTVDGVVTQLANKTYEDLTDSQRIAFEKQIKQNVKSDLSQYPQTELFIYRDGKVLPDTQLKTGAYYNEDIYDFLYQFATTKDKRDDLTAGWAGSELQGQDQRIKSAVATGNTEGLSEDEIKQVNFIKQFKK